MPGLRRSSTSAARRHKLLAITTRRSARGSTTAPTASQSPPPRSTSAPAPAAPAAPASDDPPQAPPGPVSSFPERRRAPWRAPRPKHKKPTVAATAATTLITPAPSLLPGLVTMYGSAIVVVVVVVEVVELVVNLAVVVQPMRCTPLPGRGTWLPNKCSLQSCKRRSGSKRSPGGLVANLALHSPLDTSSKSAAENTPHASRSGHLAMKVFPPTLQKTSRPAICSSLSSSRMYAVFNSACEKPSRYKTKIGFSSGAPLATSEIRPAPTTHNAHSAVVVVVVVVEVWFSSAESSSETSTSPGEAPPPSQVVFSSQSPLPSVNSVAPAGPRMLPRHSP
mmetsp:Transcript_61320/g.187219  ORF Transcript_61320/g.187219 Transcript_61320/m.187219 type:complete len:336 (-) Transcript_61320:483-1490(-)